MYSLGHFLDDELNFVRVAAVVVIVLVLVLGAVLVIGWLCLVKGGEQWNPATGKCPIWEAISAATKLARCFRFKFQNKNYSILCCGLFTIIKGILNTMGAKKMPGV